MNCSICPSNTACSLNAYLPNSIVCPSPNTSLMKKFELYVKCEVLRPGNGCPVVSLLPYSIEQLVHREPLPMSFYKRPVQFNWMEIGHLSLPNSNIRKSFVPQQLKTSQASSSLSPSQLNLRSQRSGSTDQMKLYLQVAFVLTATFVYMPLVLGLTCTTGCAACWKDGQPGLDTKFSCPDSNCAANCPLGFSNMHCAETKRCV